MLRIGVTGHRPHRLILPERTLARRVRSVLRELKAAVDASDEATPGPIEINSPLAEGTDQIVAREGLGLGLRLAALLPFARRDYEATFDDRARIAGFRELLKAADTRLALGGNPARPETGYVAVGVVTLARSDLILTIWDGEPAQGRGGTPEILQGALDWDIPIVWIDAIRDRTPMLLMRSPRSRSVPRLATLVRRAAPFDRASCRALVAAIRTPVPHR